jgi:hypothetical protein
MKQLFTIACTLVLGSALSFAQTGTAQNPPAGDTTGKTATSTTSKHHHGKKSSKKNKKGANTTTAPAANPSPSPK